jgi:mRNA interferase RelE/StbE
MVSYRVEFRGAAERELRRIDRQTIPRLIEAIRSLAEEPRPAGTRRQVQSRLTAYALETTGFTTLAHLMDEDFLTEAFHQLRKDAAAGIDEMWISEAFQRAHRIDRPAAAVSGVGHQLDN